MDATLIVVGGKLSKRQITLRLPTTIGRSRDIGLTIAHPMISRQHCELFEKNRLLMVRDLGSLNGTMVNGQRIEEAPLPPEAEFSIGPLTFRAQYPYEGELGALPAPRLAKPSAAAATDEDATELPDFEEVDEATPPP
jgi:pSer/pThr/pTyr-binding forkhead associated (FHA) protein